MFLGQLPGLLISFGEFAGLDLGSLDIGLIKRVDADDRPGDRRGHFPAEELLPELHPVVHGDPHDRLSRGLQRGNPALLVRVWIGRQPQIGEQAIVAVNRGRAQRLAIDRDDPLAELAGRFSEELLKPRAKIGDALGG